MILTLLNGVLQTQKRRGELNFIGEIMNYEKNPIKIGDVYGDLTIISFSEFRLYGRDKVKFWNCKCVCGKIIKRRKQSILLRKTSIFSKGCGCKRPRGKDHYAWQGVGSVSKHYFNTLCNSSKQKNLSFDITIEYIAKLIEEQDFRCYLTGWKIEFGSSYSKKIRQTASIDRVDSNKGYIKGNVKWIHSDINRIKINMPLDYFLEMCSSISQKHPVEVDLFKDRPKIYNTYKGSWRPRS